MKQSDVAEIILVRSVEEVDPEAISPAALVDAFTAAGDLDDDGAWLSRRASYLVEHCLATYRPLVRMPEALDGGTQWAVAGPLLVGVLANYLGPTSRIHVLFNPIALLIGWNLMVYVGLALQRMRRRSAGSAPAAVREPAGRVDESAAAARPSVRGSPIVRWAIRRMVPALWLRVRGTTAAAQERGAHVARVGQRFWTHWIAIARPVLVLNARRLFHWAACALTLGALIGMYGRGLVLEYNVVWRSTFIRSPEVVAWILRVFLGPAALFLGAPPPDQQNAALLMTVDGAPAASWIHLYAISAAVFVVAPRAVLAIVAAMRRRALANRLELSLDDEYYAALLGLARTRQVQRLEEAIGADVRAASGEFADAVATFVCESLYDRRIVPRLEQFRRHGGRLSALEVAIQRECASFGPELSRYVPVAQLEFERSLAERIEQTMAVELTVLPVPGAGLSGKVDAISERSGRAVAEEVGHRVADLIAGPVTAAVAVAVGTVSGGFGKVLGTAVLVGLLGTTGPVGFVVGALAALAAAGAGWWLGREELARSIQNVRLPPLVAQATLLRLNTIVASGRERCHASVRGLMDTELERLTPRIAEQIWLSVKPAVGEQQRRGMPLSKA